MCAPIARGEARGSTDRTTDQATPALEVAELQVSAKQKSLAAPSLVVLRTRRGPELATLTDVRREMGKVYRQCRLGKIRPEDGSRYSYMLFQISRVLEIAEVQARVQALERELGRRTQLSLIA